MKALIIALTLLCCSCTTTSRLFTHISPNIDTTQISMIYNPLFEHGFCLKHNGDIYNVLEGNAFTALMPFCDKEDIVAHTHPCYADPWPSDADWKVWTEYNERYGNTLFGVYNWGTLSVYSLPEKGDE